MAWYQADVAQAHEWLEQTLPLAREAGNRTDEAFALINLGALASDLGDYDRAIASAEAGLALARAVGEPEPTVLALHNLGELARQRGQGAAAARRLEEALALAREHGISWLVPNILRGLGFIAAQLGDYSRAAALFREGLEVGSARGNLGDVIDALEGVARVAAAVGQRERAARLFGAAAALRDEIATPMVPSELADVEPILDEVRGELGAERFAAAWAAGRDLSREEATAEALAFRVEPAESSQPAARGRSAAAHGLTARELDVLRLLAAGASNREIGERLFISPGTVGRHVANVFGKLGVNSRAKATAFAHRHGLG